MSKCWWQLAIVCVGLAGCGEVPPAPDVSNPTTPTATPVAPAPQSSDVAADGPEPVTAPAAEPVEDVTPPAVKTLEASGAKLTKQPDGWWAVDWTNATIDDDALEPLQELTVGAVILNGAAITDVGLQTLGALPDLIALDVRECKITNAGLAHLTGLQKLKSLQLSGKSGATTVDDGGMEQLAKLTQLKVLGLDYLWVSEEGLAKLQPLANLERLFLSQTLIDDAAVAQLPQFPNLKQLPSLARQSATPDSRRWLN